MNNELLSQAQQLSNRPHVTMVVLDQTTENEPIYIAFHPELEGCLAQGRTSKEAALNLQAARLDFIYSLLHDQLPVPPPGQVASTQTSSPDNSLSIPSNPQQPRISISHELSIQIPV